MAESAAILDTVNYQRDCCERMRGGLPVSRTPIASDGVALVRRFNRFYTRQIGALNSGFLESPFSLTEVRVMYELAHRPKVTAAELCRDLGLDAGYVSRILQRFQKRGFVDREAPRSDGRQWILRLTRKGRDTFAGVEARQHEAVRGMLKGLSVPDRRRMVDAMQQIQALLSGAQPESAPFTLRTHRPGDMGWVVQRHGELYAREYNWDERFEALVARICADFVDHFDAERERCWIAERGGQNVGSVFCVKKSKTVAKLRLLLVEPEARGFGIGKRLVSECIAFARAKGYKRMTLWTNNNLHAARHIYEEEGFKLVAEERHNSFGHDLVGQNWDLQLEV